MKDGIRIITYCPAKDEVRLDISSKRLEPDVGTVYLLSGELPPSFDLRSLLSSEKDHSRHPEMTFFYYEDLPVEEMQALDNLELGEVLLEVIGRKAIPDLYPGLALFVARIMKGGQILPASIVNYRPKVFQIQVITLSDRAFKGVYEDRSGPEVERLTREHFVRNKWRSAFQRQIIPDNMGLLQEVLSDAIDNQVDLIITTGGTGVGPRDITPEIVRQVIDKEIPGIMEMIRVRYGNSMPRALLSRGVAGVKGQTLIYALPGSIGAVRDYMKVIHETMDHLFFMVRGIDVH